MRTVWGMSRKTKQNGSVRSILIAGLSVGKSVGVSKAVYANVIVVMSVGVLFSVLVSAGMSVIVCKRSDMSSIVRASDYMRLAVSLRFVARVSVTVSTVVLVDVRSCLR